MECDARRTLMADVAQIAALIGSAEAKAYRAEQLQIGRVVERAVCSVTLVDRADPTQIVGFGAFDVGDDFEQFCADNDMGKFFSRTQIKHFKKSQFTYSFENKYLLTQSFKTKK